MLQILSRYLPTKVMILLLGEYVLIVGSFICAAKLRFLGDGASFMAYVFDGWFLLQASFVAGVYQLCFYYTDLYDLNKPRTRSEHLAQLGISMLAGSCLLWLTYYWVPSLSIGRGVFFFGLALSACLIWVVHSQAILPWRVPLLVQRVLVVGDGELAACVAAEFAPRNELNVHLVGFVSGSQNPQREVALTNLADYPVLGTLDDLESVVQKNRIGRIILALEDRRGNLPIRELVKLRVQGVEIEDAHTALTALTGRVWLDSIRPSWFVYSDGFSRRRIGTSIKRAADLIISPVALVLASPLMVLAAIWIRLTSAGPVFYSQERVGLRGQRFRLLKFRTMYVDAESQGGAQWASENDPRITRAGYYLRKCRVDELPQLINVMRGDMTLVGPRPERPEFVHQLNAQIPFYGERHSVRPGITGWAQVRYPYGASVEDSYRKLELDLFYLRHMSVLMDLMILVKTVGIVLFGRGAR